MPPPPACAAQAACASAVARGYDLVAVQPGSERLFHMACSSLDCDLVSLDLARRLPFRFKPAAVKAALARGLHFEVGGAETSHTCQRDHVECVLPAAPLPAVFRSLTGNRPALRPGAAGLPRARAAGRRLAPPAVC